MLRIICLLGILGCAATTIAQPYTSTSAIVSDYNFAHTLDSRDIPLNIFPNPMSDVLTIWTRDLHPDTIHHVRVLGVSGEPVLQTTLINQETNLDLSHLPEGWYIVHLRKGKEQRVQRVFKTTGP